MRVHQDIEPVRLIAVRALRVVFREIEISEPAQKNAINAAPLRPHRSSRRGRERGSRVGERVAIVAAATVYATEHFAVAAAAFIRSAGAGCGPGLSGCGANRIRK